MSKVCLLNEGNVTESVLSIFDQVRHHYGFVPNLLKAVANVPNLLEVFVPLWGAVYQAKDLGKRNRAFAALGVALTKQCGYCIPHMSASALQAGISQEEIQALKENRLNELSEPSRCIFQFAREITRNGGSVPDDLMEKVRAHLNESALVALVMTVAMYNFTGIVLKALDIELDSLLEGKMCASLEANLL